MHITYTFNFEKVGMSEDEECALVAIDCDRCTDSTIGRTDDFPGYTIWEKGRCCGCVPTAYVPLIDKTFVGHWEVQLLAPVAVAILMSTSFIVFLACAVPVLYQEALYMTPILFVLLALFAYNYYRILADGPGYLPFYWPARDELPRQSYLDEDRHGIHGVVSVDEQFEWLQIRVRPPRSIYTRTARRFVFRPDHQCYWAASWIGKLNHKFFVLFNFYGVLYCSTYIVELIRATVKILKGGKFTVILVCLFAYITIAAVFLVMTGNFLVVSLYNGSKNLTTWEIWNDIEQSKYDRGSACLNLEDVMGGGSKLAWILPISPWKGMTVDEMATSYGSYDTA